MANPRYSFGESCELLGIDAKTAKRWLDEAGITPEIDRYDKRRRWYTRDQLEAVARARGRELTDETSPPALTLERLERRVVILETQLHQVEQELASLRFTRAPAHRTPARDRTETANASESHPSATYKQPLMYSADLPDSARGRARWVEEHGGPPWTYVRDWTSEVREWQTIEDVIASVRRRRGWETWTPTGE